MMVAAGYDVLELKYADGSPAVLRHIDGSGFIYYSSGRKAICISAHGVDGKGRSRRFGAVIHSDNARSTVLGTFDEWGRGHAEGMPGATDTQAPKVLITERELTVIDGTGGVAVVPRGGDASSPGGRRGARGADAALRLNEFVVLQHKGGRTQLDFQCNGVSHSILLGEMQGEEVQGMKASTKTCLAESTMREIGEVTAKLNGVRNQVSSLRVDPSHKEGRPGNTFAMNTATLQDVLDSLQTFQQTLAHPNLAPADLTWKNEQSLKKMLASSHPRCPGQKKNWSIAQVSGKCTEARLATTKPTVATPKSIVLVSVLKLPELIDECASSSTLLVVVCLAAFAQEASNFARLLGEKANAELALRYEKRSGPPPMKIVALELTEATGFAKEYGVKEVPYCLMFRGGSCVYSKRISASKISLRDTYLARPRVLLVERNPAYQFKLERTLRRSGYESDLAMDCAHAARLASREQRYGIVLASALLPAEQLCSVVSTIQQARGNALILGFNSMAQDGQDHELRQPFLDVCTFAFQYMPSYTGLAAVLSRHDAAQPVYKHVGQSKEDFVDEILGVLGEGGGGTSSNDFALTT